MLLLLIVYFSYRCSVEFVSILALPAAIDQLYHLHAYIVDYNVGLFCNAKVIQLTVLCVKNTYSTVALVLPISILVSGVV